MANTAIFFCEGCGKRLTAELIKSGECRQAGTQLWCPDCVRSGTAKPGGNPYPGPNSGGSPRQSPAVAAPRGLSSKRIILPVRGASSKKLVPPSRGVSSKRISAAGRRHSSRVVSVGEKRSKLFYVLGATLFAGGVLFLLLAFMGAA